MLSRMLNRSTRRRPLVESLEFRHMLAATNASMTDGVDQVADFALLDVNPTSATYNQTVSPRDYLGQVSAWYFGHST